MKKLVQNTIASVFIAPLRNVLYNMYLPGKKVKRKYIMPQVQQLKPFHSSSHGQFPRDYKRQTN